MFYVYVYLNPFKPGNFTFSGYNFNYQPFYIGKGKGDRCYYHTKVIKNNRKYKKNLKYNTIEEIINKDKEPIIVKLENNLNEDVALRLEKSLIILMGRMNISTGILTNLCDGGWKPLINYIHSEETKLKISNAGENRYSKNYILTSPNDEIYTNICLKEFCMKNKLNYDKIRKSSNKGEIKIRNKKNAKVETLNCAGWRVENIKKPKVLNMKKYILFCPHGRKYKTNNLTDFCHDNNLDYRIMIQKRNKGTIKIKNISLSNKPTLNCNGWKIFNTKNNSVYDNTTIKTDRYILISPDGIVYKEYNLNKFAKNNNLNVDTLRTFMDRGKIKYKPFRKNLPPSSINSINWEVKKI